MVKSLQPIRKNRSKKRREKEKKRKKGKKRRRIRCFSLFFSSFFVFTSPAQCQFMLLLSPTMADAKGQKLNDSQPLNCRRAMIFSIQDWNRPSTIGAQFTNEITGSYSNFFSPTPMRSIQKVLGGSQTSLVPILLVSDRAENHQVGRENLRFPSEI